MSYARPFLALALAALAVPVASSATEAVPVGCGVELRMAESLPIFERDHDFALDNCTGKIRPGAPMTSPAGCTYSFILRDAQGNLYTGSAAHCVSGVGQRVSTSIIGQFGTVVTDGALGVDYALIRIDANKHHLVEPTLCSWGGPVGPDPGDRPQNDILLEYGWGVATQFHAASRTRTLVETSRSANFIEWAGVGSGGDSGGPVVSVEGYAVGSHTYGVTPIAGVVREGGPTLARMLASGRTAVPTLELVNGDPTNVELLAQDLRG